MAAYTDGPCIKGPACQALDKISLNQPAMKQLQLALAGISGSKFAGLENVMAQYLFPAAYSQPDIDKIRVYLNAHWFDAASATYYFPGHDAANVYGAGLLKVLEQSIAKNVPIDAWWALDHATIDMLTLVTPRQATFIIATPRPNRTARAKAAASQTIGFSTRQIEGTAQTRQLEIP